MWQELSWNQDAPQIRLNANDSDLSDDDRSMPATSNSNFVTTAVDNDTILRGTATGNLLFGVGTSEKVRITSGGKIGITKGTYSRFRSCRNYRNCNNSIHQCSYSFSICC